MNKTATSQAVEPPAEPTTPRNPFASPLTTKQANVLRFLEVYIAEAGRSPSVREIADAFDVSTSSVVSRLNTLEKLGFIARSPAEFGSPLGRRAKRAIVVLRRAPIFAVVALRRDDGRRGAA